MFVKRFAAITLVTVVLLSFSGCSWLNQFFVFNRSSQPIVVRLEMPAAQMPEKPAVLKINSWNTDRVVLGDTVKAYSRVTDGVLYLELPSQTAFLLGESLNRDLHRENDCRAFTDSIFSLELISANDNQQRCKKQECFGKLVVINKYMAGFVMQ